MIFIILYQFIHKKQTVIFRLKFEFNLRREFVYILLENCGLNCYNFINDNEDNTQAAIIIITLLMIIMKIIRKLQ